MFLEIEQHLLSTDDLEVQPENMMSRLATVSCFLLSIHKRILNLKQSYEWSGELC